MLQLLRFVFHPRLIQPVLKPITRLFLGLIAVPFFRLVMRRVIRVQDISSELEKDLELWFRGALLLLIATANMEDSLFQWVPILFGANPIPSIPLDIPGPLNDPARVIEIPWYVQAGRILLAIGVIEGMPDQSLFALIHPGPRKPEIQKGRVIQSLFRYMPEFLRGIFCQHLNRSSPVFAILSVLHKGEIGWICYGIAIAQYLLIGLVSSKDKAFDVLGQIDSAISRQRTEIESELGLTAATRIAAARQLKAMDPNSESL